MADASIEDARKTRCLFNTSNEVGVAGSWGMTESWSVAGSWGMTESWSVAGSWGVAGIRSLAESWNVLGCKKMANYTAFMAREIFFKQFQTSVFCTINLLEQKFPKFKTYKKQTFNTWKTDYKTCLDAQPRIDSICLLFQSSSLMTSSLRTSNEINPACLSQSQPSN